MQKPHNNTYLNVLGLQTTTNSNFKLPPFPLFNNENTVLFVDKQVA